MNAVIDMIRTESTAQVTIDTPLGALCLVRTPRGLAGAWFAGQKHHPGAIDADERPDDPLLMRAARQLQAYFGNGAAAGFDLPLDLVGTPFQRRVWQALQRIPPGATRSYAQVAEAIGAPQAVRAVGAAVGRNPLSVIVPCHRVVGTDGSLTGYAGGVERKRWLLAREGRPVPADIAVALA
jgi:methylated-DNA-[protein]-cysteine S-methyltransferase